MIKDALVAAIKKIRNENKWSRENLARKIGMSAQTIYRWEEKGMEPSPLAKEKLRGLGIQI